MLDDLTAAEALIEAANIIERTAGAATPGPWWSDGRDADKPTYPSRRDSPYRLHGVGGRMPAVGDFIPEQVINKQILKAPRDSNNLFQEYWPDDHDDAWITMMNPLIGNSLSFWLESEAQKEEPNDHAVVFAETIIEHFRRKGRPPSGA